MRMLDALNQDNFIVIDNFIDTNSANALYKHFVAETKDHPEMFKRDPQCPKSMSIYNFRWFLELLINKIPFMDEIMEEPMFPTYSYARLYSHGEELIKHVDKPICEVSVSMHLGSDGTEWPIYVTKPNKEIVGINLKPGQAIIYYGLEAAHWRDKFEGQEYGQVFLHYVKGRGNNWKRYFDKE